MKKVIVYVEGRSDKVSMEALLKPLIEQKANQGIGINFIPRIQGDAKNFLLTQLPNDAANIVLNDPTAVVIIMPDLYPKNKGFDHETYQEMSDGIYKRFESAVRKKGSQLDDRLTQRFKVFCFKYDLEALLLASLEALKLYLSINNLKVTWLHPVEDQNHDDPPKRVVERLFREYGQQYQETIDAPAILSKANYPIIAQECPQCFKPFVEFLESLE